MDAEGLRSLVERARDHVDDGLSERTVQLRVVEPVLAELGWDLRSGDVTPDYRIGGERVDYALLADDRPAVVVESRAPSDPLEPAVELVAGVLEATAVDWGIATDGSAFVLVTTTRGQTERLRLDLEELPDRTSALGEYTRVAAQQRRERTRVAGERLRERRTAAVDAVADALVEITDGAAADRITAAAESVVDDLIEDLGQTDARNRDEEPSSSAKSQSRTSPTEATRTTDDAGKPEDEDDATPTATARSSDGGDDASTGDGPDTGSNPEPASPSATPADDRETAESAAPEDVGDDRERGSPTAAANDSTASPGFGDEGGGPTEGQSPDRAASGDQYVVRFFSGTSSVGAVGTGTPGETLAGAVEYLGNHHAIGNRLTLPWGLDGEPPLLAREQLDGGKDLGDGTFVRTDVEASTARRAIDRLADRAGLRVMFQGDW